MIKYEDMKIKVIANYLPQYHRIPENDKWWGEGYTDWVAVKNAQPLFEGHRQPRIPLNNNYYDLSDINAIRWQADLACKYGVYGFGIYHYWFNSDLQLLQKPSELLLQNKDIDIHFMFIWDNGSWKRSWSNVKDANDWAPQFDGTNIEDNGILAELDYGNESDWEKHFNYLLPFFKDERYIKIDGRPLFGLFRIRENNSVIKEMISCWNKLAQKNGFNGVMVMNKRDVRPWYNLKNSFMYLQNNPVTFWQGIKRKFKCLFGEVPQKVFDYDEIWIRWLKIAKNTGHNIFLSGGVNYDDSPRRGKDAVIYKGSTPQKFQKYFTELLKISKQQGKEYVFCPAWNEWGEGMYLEPDTVDGYAYLEALKAAVDEVNGD